MVCAWRLLPLALTVATGLGFIGRGRAQAQDPAGANSDRALADDLRSSLDAFQKLGSSKESGEARSKAVTALVTALDRITESAKARPAVPPAGPEAADLGKMLARAAGIEVLAVIPAAWRAAAWYGHPSSVSAFQTAGERLLLFPGEATHAYFAIAKDVASLDARRAFVAASEKIFGSGPERDEQLRKEFVAALDACAAAAGSPPKDAPPAAAAGLLASFEAAAKAPGEEYFADVARALARAPSGGPRAVLRRALKARKAIQDATLISVLAALGTTGDSDAVPILLSYLPSTPAPIFEAAYFGLWTCKPEGLRPHAKEALGVLIPLLDEEGFAANAVSGAATPRAVRIKERMAVVARLAPRMTQEKGAGGWHALLWKIVDAGSDAIRATNPPPDRQGWTHVNGRVTPLSTTDWAAWWKTAK